MSGRPADIPALRLQVLKKLIERFTAPPNLHFINLFGTDRADSDTIKWESRIGTRGMTPFAAPGQKAEVLAPTGVAENEAKAAYWKEKMFFDEELLNNLREPGTIETYHTAEKRVAWETTTLANREMRRREWMLAKAFTSGGFDYYLKGGHKVSVDYGIPDAHMYALTTDYKWGSGTSSNPVKDIMDAKLMLQNSCGAELSKAIITTEVLNVMIMDENVQALLAKSAFGNGDLFARPKEVLMALLGIGDLQVYDEQYQVRAFLTASVTGSSTTVLSVDETVDFEVGDTLRLMDPINKRWEDETVSAVDHDAGTITIASAPDLSFAVGHCFVFTTKKFLPTDQFTMYATEVEGQPTAEWLEAPFGLGRNYGPTPDRKETWDPDGLFIRIQNKGLPVIYNNDAIVGITVF